MTAAETWRYGGDDIPYSMYVGGVGEMPNGSRFMVLSDKTNLSRAGLYL